MIDYYYSLIFEDVCLCLFKLVVIFFWNYNDILNVFGNLVYIVFSVCVSVWKINDIVN